LERAVPDDCNSKEPKTEIDILSYFVRNPQAADNLQGVGRWRLLEEALYSDLDRVERALRWLVNEGFLLVMSKPGMDDVFTLNPRRVADARRLLSRHKSVWGPGSGMA
jgi:hypothetical protein